MISPAGFQTSRIFWLFVIEGVVVRSGRAPLRRARAKIWRRPACFVWKIHWHFSCLSRTRSFSVWIWVDSVSGVERRLRMVPVQGALDAPYMCLCTSLHVFVWVGQGFQRFMECSIDSIRKKKWRRLPARFSRKVAVTLFLQNRLLAFRSVFSRARRLSLLWYLETVKLKPTRMPPSMCLCRFRCESPPVH